MMIWGLAMLVSQNTSMNFIVIASIKGVMEYDAEDNGAQLELS
jgi:hypothetical protein